MSNKASNGSYEDRKRIFDDNHLPERKAKNILQLAWMAYNDKVLMVLTVAAVIALALGLYQALGTAEGGFEWIEEGKCEEYDDTAQAMRRWTR